jgi:hypothetical protein
VRLFLAPSEGSGLKRLLGMLAHHSSAQKIKEETRLFDALADIINDKVIDQWLQRPNQ